MALRAAGRRWDEVLHALRTDRFSKNDAIRATAEAVLRLSLADTKRLVHESEAWRDAREPDERSHDDPVGDLQPQVTPRQR